MISDKTAYRRYLDGEEKAADLLVERYGDALTLYINGYIKDIHEAEDLMIEAFSQLFAKERPIEGEGSFKAYLYKIARHLALRHKRADADHQKQAGRHARRIQSALSFYSTLLFDFRCPPVDQAGTLLTCPHK